MPFFDLRKNFQFAMFWLSENKTLPPIDERDKIEMCFNDGRIESLSDVMHVPSLERNLISVSMLNDMGLHVRLDKHGCR